MATERNLISQAIMRGALAGALAELSGTDDALSAGLMKCSDFHHAAATAMLDRCVSMNGIDAGDSIECAARAPFSTPGARRRES